MYPSKKAEKRDVGYHLENVGYTYCSHYCRKSSPFSSILPYDLTGPILEKKTGPNGLCQFSVFLNLPLIEFVGLRHIVKIISYDHQDVRKYLHFSSFRKCGKFHNKAKLIIFRSHFISIIIPMGEIFVINTSS